MMGERSNCKPQKCKRMGTLFRLICFVYIMFGDTRTSETTVLERESHCHMVKTYWIGEWGLVWPAWLLVWVLQPAAIAAQKSPEDGEIEEVQKGQEGQGG